MYIVISAPKQNREANNTGISLVLGLTLQMWQHMVSSNLPGAFLIRVHQLLLALVWYEQVSKCFLGFSS